MLTASLVMVVATGALAGAPGGTNYLANGDFQSQGASWNVPAGAAFVAGAGPEGRSALRIPTDPRPGQATWDVQLVQPVARAFKRGEAVRLSFWARSSTGNRMRAVWQDAGPPYTANFETEVRLGSEWRQYRVEGAAHTEYAPGGSSVAFQFNYDPGTVELAGVALSATPESGATFENPIDLLPGFGPNRVAADAYRVSGTPVPEASVVPVSGVPGGATQALRLKTNPAPGSNPWGVVAHMPTQARISAGDVVELRGWVRSPDRGRVGLHVEMAGPPHTKYISQIVRGAPEWKEFRVATAVPGGFDAGEAQIALFLGYGPGTLELAGLSLRNYGKADLSKFPQLVDYWGGERPNDDWRKAAEARIEKIRKGDLVIEVVDAAGKPVRNAQIQIEQQRHAFKWGTAIPAARILQKDADGEKYRGWLKRVFNTVVFENDLKWPQDTPESRANVAQAMEWLKANDFAVRGHNLVWGSWQYMPAGYQTLPADQLKQRIRDRVADAAGHYKGQLYIWDVVNEAVTERAVWDKLGWQAFADVFKWAREADPSAQLCYNDFNATEEAQVGPAHRNRMIEIIREAKKNGAPIDVIGLQGHVGVPLTPIGRVVEILDEMGDLGMPLEITEFDIGGVWDPQLHAKHTADFMTASFAEPRMQAFLFWGFWESSHWRAREGAAMIRRDWSVTPTMTAVEDLIKNQWWTRASLRSDAQGEARARAFYGTHQVTVTLGGRKAVATVELVPGKPGLVRVRL